MLGYSSTSAVQATADVNNDATATSANAESADATADEQPRGVGGNHADPAGHG